MLTSQLPTLITSRAEALAAALESELAERELEATEAERLLETRRQEIEQIHRQTLALAAADEDDGYDERQRAELEELVMESKRLLEHEQSAELGRAIREEEAKVPPHMRMSTTSSNSNGGYGHSNNGGVDTEKLNLAHALRAQQAARTVLVADVVTAQSLTGGESGEGQRHDIYKRLLTGALGAKAEDVESLLPEILRQLEEGRTGDSTGIDVAMSGSGFDAEGFKREGGSFVGVAA